MAGVYGEIDSNASFHRVLGEAIDVVHHVLAHTPGNGTLQRILKQLDAMKLWTHHGLKPSDGQRRSIDVGLVAARELSDATGEVRELAKKLFALNNYFEDWPTDEKAANATEEDFFDDE